MFQSVVDHTKLTVSATAAKYVGRLIVGVLILIAAGFALAAVTVALANQFGAPTACIIVSAAFVLIACIAWMFVVANDRYQTALLKRAEFDRRAFSANIAAAAPLALAGGMKMFGGRIPLLVGALVIGALVMRNMTGAADSSSAD